MSAKLWNCWLWQREDQWKCSENGLASIVISDNLNTRNIMQIMVSDLSFLSTYFQLNFFLCKIQMYLKFWKVWLDAENNEAQKYPNTVRYCMKGEASVHFLYAWLNVLYLTCLSIGRFHLKNNWWPVNKISETRNNNIRSFKKQVMNFRNQTQVIGWPLAAYYVNMTN